ncbi:MAG: ParA family protein [Lachnospiraceae bacterium]|nr:ParA family protein [Lachnospiraceae bacterium]
MKVTSAVSNKGGVGKSTSAYNIASAVSYVVAPAEGQSEARVLFIDLDESCDGTRMFAPEYDGSQEMCSELGVKSLYDFFTGPDDRQSLLSCICQTNNPGISILLGSSRNQSLAEISKNDIGELRRRLSVIADDFDVCVIDCPPARGYTTLMAMFASDVIIPCSDISFGGLTGVKNALADIDSLMKKYPSYSVDVSTILVRSFPPMAGVNEENEIFAKDRGASWYLSELSKITSLQPTFLRNDPLFVTTLREKGLSVYSNPQKALTKQYAAVVVELTEIFFKLPLRQPPYSPFAVFYPSK